jgi:hypothetical protein
VAASDLLNIDQGCVRKFSINAYISLFQYVTTQLEDQPLRSLRLCETPAFKKKIFLKGSSILFPNISTRQFCELSPTRSALIGENTPEPFETGLVIDPMVGCVFVCQVNTGVD